jgi:hypothetical protein
VTRAPPPGEHAGQVPLAAARIKDRCAGDVPEEPEDVRVEQDTPRGIALRIECRKPSSTMSR